MPEINYTADTKMHGRFPEIKKLGIVSPNGETTPFVWNGKLMRLELCDPSRGTNPDAKVFALIRERDSGKILSRFGEGCYYYSFYQENGTAYVIGTVSQKPRLSGDSFKIYESRDLINWTERPLFTNPGWMYFNTSLVKGDNGYVMLMEALEKREYVGDKPFTFFFATSPDLVHWTMMDYSKCFSKERYMGGPYMYFSEGWYYVFAVTELPCKRYTNYIYRTKDFDTWYVGLYNPVLMPSNEDFMISDHAFDITDEMKDAIKTGFNINNSDIDICEWNGKTLMTYLTGNQLGFYFLAEAVCDMPPAQFLKSYFE